MSASVCLIFMYNHRFDENISKLEKIYDKRFSHIFHLVPFYDGSKENVIPVYENSFYFQGYIPQAIHRFYKASFSHYFFVGDDVLLHPDINENNVLNYLKADENTAFLPDLWGALSKLSYGWTNTFPALNAFYSHDILFHHAVDWRAHFPDTQKAFQKFNKLGIDFKKLKPVKLQKGAAFSKNRQMYVHYIKSIFKRRRSLPYPLVAGYSDIFLIPASVIHEFSHLCEITRQMRLWVEVAIPTISISICEKINFEKDIQKKGSTYWVNENIEQLTERENACAFDLEKLFLTFAPDELYIHPVKLSKWSVL